MARRAPSREAGFTLVETLVAVGLVLVLALGAMQYLKGLEEGRAHAALSADAERQIETLSGALTKAFKSRHARRADGGFKIAACTGGKGDCLEMFRVRVTGKDTTVTERILAATRCVPMTTVQKQTLTGEGVPLPLVGGALRGDCAAVSCPSGQRAVVEVRTWRDERDTSKSETKIVPGGERINPSLPVAAALCVARKGTTQLQLTLAGAFLRKGKIWQAKTVKRVVALPLAEDKSKVEWLP